MFAVKFLITSLGQVLSVIPHQEPHTNRMDWIDPFPGLLSVTVMVE